MLEAITLIESSCQEFLNDTLHLTMQPVNFKIFEIKTSSHVSDF